MTAKTSGSEDPQGGSMAYIASLANGGKLPSWLSSNATTLPFSGTAPAPRRA